MLSPLDGPSKQGSLSVGTATPVIAKVGASSFSDRKVITLQSSDNKFYVYFADSGETPNAATVAANGFIQFKDQKESYEAGEQQIVYLLSASGTINIKIAERS
jgi:hypothetical protein